MNSDELKEITQQLADVELPPAPDWQPLMIAATVVAAAILLAAGVIYLRSRRKYSSKASSANRDALHQLELLQQEWQQDEVDDHDAAYRLATLLRLGLNLNQLTEMPPAPLHDQQQRWQALLQQLAQLRYRPHPHPTPLPRAGEGDKAVLTAAAFAQVEQWLKQGNAPC